MSHNHMPRNVNKRILAAGARGERAVVVVFSKKKPSRVFALEKYRKMQELPSRVKPWTARKTTRDVPDPLRAIEGRVLEPIRRKNVYDEG